jgi:hypothetical protein
MRSRILLSFACLALVGCMPLRYYPLPVSAAEARATFAPLATAASNLGYKQWQWNDSMSFEPDPYTQVSYMVGPTGTYVMCVMIKDKNAPGGLDTAFAAGKAKGDDVWNRAMALRPSIPMPPPVEFVAPPPSPVQINISH